MDRNYIVTATGTDIGKTVLSAMLTLGLGASYWKPVQSGKPTDTETVRTITGLPHDRFHPERYLLTEPLSPHRSAAIDGVGIDLDELSPPEDQRPMIIEGAGGLMVPLTDDTLQIDLFRRWGYPLILAARTELGTINHTLLSLEAMRARGMPVLGVAFIGPDMPDTVETIARLGRVKILGRLPMLDRLDAESLRAAFAAHFDLGDFQHRHARP